MRVFKTRTFNRWAKGVKLTDQELNQAVMEIRRGLIDAQLGGGVIKKRIRRTDRGKRTGYRSILATNMLDRYIFLYGFAKNERENIDDSELRMLKRLSKTLLTMNTRKVKDALSRGELVEIDYGE